MGKRKGTFVPKRGTIVHPAFPIERSGLPYAAAIAAALRQELGDTNGAIKIAMRWTGASERTVKYWFAGARGPSGEHLILLARHSDVVFGSLLVLIGRRRSLDTDRAEAAKAMLQELLAILSGEANPVG